MNVGVLRGGTSSEYDLSLKTGAAMMAALPEERYLVRDIFIDRNGFWHLRGMPVEPARALSQLDVALNALHGGVGEDGTVQRILVRAGVPFSGSTGLSSALALNKIRAREILERTGIRMPRAVSFIAGRLNTTRDMARAAFSQFPPPYIIKPAVEGAGSGIVVARTLPELTQKIGDVLEKYGAALIEEYIPGAQASVGVIEKFRNQELYVLPPARVELPAGAAFFEPAHHVAGGARHVVPSDFSDEEKRALINLSRAAHRALGLSHFSRAEPNRRAIGRPARRKKPARVLAGDQRHSGSLSGRVVPAHA